MHVHAPLAFSHPLVLLSRQTMFFARCDFVEALGKELEEKANRSGFTAECKAVRSEQSDESASSAHLLTLFLNAWSTPDVTDSSPR